MIRATINQNQFHDGIDLPGNQILRMMVRRWQATNSEKEAAIENCTWLNYVNEQLSHYDAKMVPGGWNNNSPIAIDFYTESLYTYCLLEATGESK